MNLSKKIGGIMLISGTSVGAGLLATPIDTATAGFGPAAVGFFICWFFMTLSAFYALEVNLIFPKENNFISMAYNTLGNIGKGITWSAYLLLLYALICAYLVASNDWFLQLIQEKFNLELKSEIGLVAISILFAVIIGSGTSIVDKFNRFFAVGLIFVYSFLISVTLPEVNFDNYLYGNFYNIIPSISLILTAFGFAIIVPSLTAYFKQSVKDLRQIIFIGSIISLAIYLFWEFVVLGALPLNGSNSLVEISKAGGKGTDIAMALEAVSGNKWIIVSSRILSIFVVLTSFLGVALSLFDFLKDGLKLSNKFNDKLKLLLISFFPPLLISITMYNHFIRILSFAGIFVAIILGIIPAAMVYSARYSLRKKYDYKVWGGKALIFFNILFFSFAIFQEVSNWL